MELTITRAEVRPYVVPLPLLGIERAGWHLDLHTADGRLGRGDAAPWPGFGADRATVEAALATPLSGRRFPANDPDALDAAIDALALPAPAAYALGLALHDLAAARRGLSLARWIAHGPGADPAPTVAAHRLVATPTDARAARAAGYTALKVKIGAAPLADDLARVRAVRDAAPTAALRIDANAAYDRPTAAAAAAALARLDVAWFEQPLAAADLDGHRALRRLGVPIALDESLVARPALDPALCDGVVIKPMFLGLGPARAFIAEARAHGVAVCVTHALESPVGRRGALHLAALAGPGPHGVGDAPLTALEGMA